MSTLGYITYIFPNWSTESTLTVVSLFLALIAGAWTLLQWQSAKKLKRADLLDTIISKVRLDDQMFLAMIDISHGCLAFDDGGFYNKDDAKQKLSYKVDKLLSYFNYTCYLHKTKHISNKELGILKYDLIQIYRSEAIQKYLRQMYRFSANEKIDCVYQYLIDYGIKNKHLPPDFKTQAMAEAK